ncbi:peptidylprolyl isomerase [Amphritea balenae]|uniref:Chaperone SurA n=1 Tax=Amphritea balenae TaxID=452629 RepID=A0A3P1SPW9_9GAMM|nr:peptidylprolyl isomerase [Amphritea balenae]RRC99163.1 molecular chaperone SurA [Amphritea balenae]GGK73411.1 chaperone SurA [Amphritea balenae]
MTIKLVNKLKPGLTALLITASLSVPAAPVTLDQIVAIVNDDIVLQSELNDTEQSIRSRLAAQGRAIPDDQILQRQILDRLILENIQLQLGEQQGIRVSDSELNSALERIASRSGLSLEQFRETLIAEGQNYTEARQQIRTEMLIQKIQQRIVSSRIRVSQQEIDNFLTSEQGQQQNAANYRLSQILIGVPLQATPEMIQKAEQQAKVVAEQLNAGVDFSATAIAQSQGPNALKGGDIGWRKLNEIPEQFAAVVKDLNPGQFSTPVRSPSGFHILKVNDKQGSSVQLVEQVKVRHILLSPNEIRSPAQTRREIETLYQRLRNGVPFEEIAKQYSDDAGSGSQGGSLGWAQPGQMVPEFEQVMFNTDPGQTSAPFESRFGWHILKVEDRRQQDMGEEMQANQARSSIRQRKYNEELQNWLREIRSQAYIELK